MFERSGARFTSDAVGMGIVVVAVVIECRVLLCVACEQGGSTALLLACGCGHLDVARWLVEEAGCDARSERDKVC
jgi:hypothetical protein